MIATWSLPSPPPALSPHRLAQELDSITSAGPRSRADNYVGWKDKVTKVAPVSRTAVGRAL